MAEPAAASAPARADGLDVPGVIDLAQCSEFRQTLVARPPRIVHGASAAILAILGAAIAWAAATRADTVVRAPARVRPASGALRSFAAPSGEEVTSAIAGRVAEVAFRPGQSVRAGDALVRLDTARLDSEIAGVEQQIAALGDELAHMDRLAALLDDQFGADQARADAELSYTAGTVHEGLARRRSELRAAQAEQRAAQQELERVTGLVAGGAASRADLQAAELRASRAREAVATASLPVGAGRIEVLRRERGLAERDHEVASERLRLDAAGKRAALAAARQKLAGLGIDKQQTVVRAHIDGVVTTGELRVGDLVDPSRPLCAIAPAGGVRIDAAVGPADVAQIHPGMPVRVRLDAYDAQRDGVASGVVEAISPDAAALAAPGGGQAAYYLVRVSLDDDRVGDSRIRLGMTGEAEIITGRPRLLSVLLSDLHRAISLGGSP
jgi:adhesin transport system membrane fusion protein